MEGTLAWQIPWAEEPGGLQSTGSLGVGHERLHFHFSLSCLGEGNGNSLQCSCLDNPRDGGAWWAAVYGVAQSRIRLKRLSSSSSRSISLCFKAPRRSAHLKRHLKRLPAASLCAPIYLLLRSSHLVPWDSCSASHSPAVLRPAHVLNAGSPETTPRPPPCCASGGKLQAFSHLTDL